MAGKVHSHSEEKCIFIIISIYLPLYLFSVPRIDFRVNGAGESLKLFVFFKRSREVLLCSCWQWSKEGMVQNKNGGKGRLGNELQQVWSASAPQTGPDGSARIHVASASSWASVVKNVPSLRCVCAGGSIGTRPRSGFKHYEGMEGNYSVFFLKL